MSVLLKIRKYVQSLLVGVAAAAVAAASPASAVRAAAVMPPASVSGAVAETAFASETAPAASRMPGTVRLASISSPGCGKVLLKWKKADYAASYNIYYKETGVTGWKKIASVKGTQLSYTHTSSKSFPITVGKKYTYTVRACSTAKTLGDYDKKGLTIRTIPDTVSFRSAVWNTAGTAVTLTWNKASGGDYYRIYRKSASSPNWRCIATVKADKLQYTDRSPVKGEANNYNVRAYNSKQKVAGKYRPGGITAAVPKKETALDRTARLLAATKTAKKTGQIILVADHSLSFWEKDQTGRWTRKLTAYCGYGSNGLNDDRYEGDRTTPIGSFPILHAFGIASNPGTTMQYKRVTSNSYWSGERSTYNQWVESARPVGGEHLIDYYQYKYAMAIGFNRNPTVYKKGSAIFLHCKSNDHWSTAGCVSVEEQIMKKLLLLSRNNVYIIIVRNQADLSAY